MKELEEAIAKNDAIGIRDSTGKAWNASSIYQSSSNPLPGVMPRSSFEGRMPRELEISVREMGDSGLPIYVWRGLRFSTMEKPYEVTIDVEQIMDGMVKVEGVVGDLRGLVSRSS